MKKLKKRLRFIRLAFALLAVVILVSSDGRREGTIPDLALETVAYVLLTACAIGRIWCSAYMAGNKRKRLVIAGPYSLMRNPLYFFSFLGFIGAGLVLGSWAIAAALGLFFIATHWPTILAEERRLQGLFGAQFDHYCAKVPRFFPRSLKTTKLERADFSPPLFDAAVRDCALIMSVYVIAQGLEWSHVHEVLPVLIHLP